MGGRWKLGLGFVLFVVSLFGLYLQYEKTKWIYAFFIILSWAGVVFVSDYFANRWAGVSFWPTNERKLKRILKFLVGAVIFCVLLEVAGHWLTRLWYYPAFEVPDYLLLAIPAYFLYSLVLYELYVSINKKLGREIHLIAGKSEESFYKRVMNVELLIGIIFTILGFIGLINVMRTFSISVLDISKDSMTSTGSWQAFLFALGIFFLLEFWAFKEKKRTFTKDLLSKNWIPLVAIYLTSLIAIVLIEFVNTPLQIWVFANWPLQHIQIMGLPIIAMFVAWPIQFFGLLGILRVIFDEKDAPVW
jgi:hypothetical protein